MVLIAGLFALAAQASNPIFLYLALLPSISFWFLDGYYLYQEQLYRNLYEDTRAKEEKDINFSMDTKTFKGKNKATWLKSTFSKTLNVFHGVVFSTIIVIMLFILLR